MRSTSSQPSKRQPEAERRLQQIGDRAIAAREDPLDVRLVVLVRLEVDAQLARQVAEQRLLALGLGGAVHRHPLERRVRLGDVGRHRRRDARGAQVAVADLLHARRRLDDAAHVGVLLGRQADHEVQLHALEAAPEHAVRRLDDVLLGDVLGDDVAHALRAGLGRERQTARAHGRHLAQQIFVQPVGAQRRHRQRHLLVAQLGHRRLHQRRHARIVGGRQRRQRRLVVAALLDPADERVDDRDRVALAHRPVDHAGLAETAALGAAARDLDRHAVEDRLGVRQRRVVGEREAVDVGDPGALRARRHARIQRRPDDHEAGLGVDLGRVQLRHVQRIALGQAAQALAAGDTGATQRRRLEHQRRQPLLGLADEERVDERRQRLGVGRGRPAGDHQRRVVAAVGGAQRQPREIQQVQHVGVGQLVLQRETDHVERRQRRRRLERQHRQAALAQLRLAVAPRREGALASDLGAPCSGSNRESWCRDETSRSRRRRGMPGRCAPTRRRDPCAPPDTHRPDSVTASRRREGSRRRGASLGAPNLLSAARPGKSGTGPRLPPHRARPCAAKADKGRAAATLTRRPERRS